MTIRGNITNIKDRIALASERAGRSPAEVKLVAVIKNIPLEQVVEALEAGVTDIGENRIQEAAGRWQSIREKFPKVKLHMIGHLQRNKVGQALDMFDIIQSVDSFRLVEEINRRAARPVSVLIEVNTSGETSKFGIEPAKAISLVKFASFFDKIKVEGLMAIGPLSGETREAFKRLKELRHEIIALSLPAVSMRWLSMGMSSDFETAIEEGSNLVRVGRAIFS